MIVGQLLHHLSRLVSLLLIGNPDTEVAKFRNAGIACLTKKEARWAIDWVMQHPEEDDPPMVDNVATIGEDGEPSTDVVLTAGSAGVICLSEGNTIDLAADLVVTDARG